MFLAIEIGGTKLQLGVGSGGGPPLAELVREGVVRERGAAAIREQIARLARPLIEKHRVTAVGIGFGGPVDVEEGRIIKRHHVEGWDDFPLADWCRENLGLPAAVGNDSDLAGLGEATFGAGQGHRVVFYSNVGTGIGGALVIDGQLYRGGSGVASEIGHLRPGLDAERPDAILESLASGWGITRAAREQALGLDTAADVAAAAAAGNEAARRVFDDACRAYGWALAQMITLLAPNAVVIGGGVSLAGEDVFFAPLRRYVDRYVFPPHKGTYRIVPSALGDEVVLHGALAIAGQCEPLS